MLKAGFTDFDTLKGGLIEKGSFTIKNLVMNTSSEWSNPQTGYVAFSATYGEEISWSQMAGQSVFVRCEYQSVGENLPEKIGFYTDDGYGSGVWNTVDNSPVTTGVNKIVGILTQTADAHESSIGNVYQGPVDLSSGYSGQVRNVMVCLVPDDLWNYLNSRFSTTQERVAFLDSLIPVLKPLEERRLFVSFSENEVEATEFIESSAYGMFVLSSHSDVFFDEGINRLRSYNNSSPDADRNPQLIREVAPDDYPLKNEHSYVVRLHWKDRTTNPTSPSLAGIYPTGYYGVNNSIHEQVLFLKAPAGLKVHATSNSVTSESYEWNTNITTGDWQEIRLKRTYTTAENQNIGGHIYFSQGEAEEVPNEFDIYLGAFMILDITENPEFFYANVADSSVAFRIVPGGIAISDEFVEEERDRISVLRKQ